MQALALPRRRKRKDAKSIGLVIPENWEPSKLIPWAASIARDRSLDLVVLRTRRIAPKLGRKKRSVDRSKRDASLREAIAMHACDFEVVDCRDTDRVARNSKDATSERDPAKRLLYLVDVNHADLIPAALKEIKALRVVQLIVPRHQGTRIDEEGFTAERQLLVEAPCETLQFRPGRSVDYVCPSVLVATSAKKRSCSALHFAAAWTAGQKKNLDALYVEQQGARVPRPIANKRIERLVPKRLRPHVAEVIPHRVVNEDVSRGVKSYATARGYDLVVVGAGRRLAEDRQVASSVPEKLMAEMEEPTVVVVRDAMPITGRVLKSIEHRKKSVVPQLDRVSRLDLVRRLQEGGRWNFDFFIMIFLATLLASLGLAVDSPAVVIGAMLVAPLMTPMLGLGLSVVQGNRRMAIGCFRTIGQGFAVAFATGLIVGMIRVLLTDGVTGQMSSRGTPGVLDLVAAFVSGIVAAYALGRPHLISALPGIAIATSLVPPVATAGMALAVGHIDVSLGATLLFVSNFVAIVLGSALCLWVVGMRGPREICPFSDWGRRWILSFAAASICLGAFFTATRDDGQLQASAIVSRDLQDSTERNVGRPTTSGSDEKRPEQSSEASDPPGKKGVGEFRIVFKPTSDVKGSSSDADITVHLPDPLRLPDSVESAPKESEAKVGPLMKVLQRLRNRKRSISIRMDDKEKKAGEKGKEKE